MKKLRQVLSFGLIFWAQCSYSQAPISVTIRQIQSVPGFRLAVCNDSSMYTGKKVTVQGVVVTAPTITAGTVTGINAIGSAACSGAFYIQDGTGPFSGLLVRQSLTPKNISTGILTLNVGDEVILTGTVKEYASTIFGGHNFPGETHLDLDTTVQIALNDFGIAIAGPTVINVSDLADPFISNNIVTGEQWEGVFVKINGVNVSDRPGSTRGDNTVPTACIPATGSRRRRFTVTDAIGNKIVIGDRFLAGRFSSPATPNNSPGATGNSEIGVPGGTFMYPNAGSVYTLSGIVSHWLNAGSGSACTNRSIITPDQIEGLPGAPTFASTAAAQGYSLNPFLPAHYELGRPLPVISNIRTFAGPFGSSVPAAIPGANVVFNIQATITQAPAPSGNSVSFTGAKVFYTTDPITNSNPTWNEVSMQSTFQGNDYYAEIPGFADGTFVRYYIEATNSDPSPNNKSYLPNKSQARFYTVRSSGLTIYDLQYTPYGDGNSIYAGVNATAGLTVTVTGVVTSSYKDLGTVYIQQENVQEWGGIIVFPQNAITNNIVTSVQTALRALERGQRVTIVGAVSETFAQTTLNASRVTVLSGTGNIKPVRLSSSTFKGNDQEKYEGMLVNINTQPFEKLKVVDPNFTSGRGSFRIGTSASNSGNGTLVMTGVQDSRYQVWTYGSLNTTYLRSKNREFNGNDGILGANVPTFDTISTATTLDSLTGIVLYNFSNQLITPRDNRDFYGMANLGSVWNPAANPANLAVTKPASTTHRLQWSIPKGYGGDGFYIDYAAPSSSLPPSTAGPYYPLKYVPATDSIVEFTGLNPSAGYLYRLRGYRNVDGNPVYSTPLQANLPGTFIIVTDAPTDMTESPMTIFPNPTNGTINYRIGGNDVFDAMKVSIYDVTGKVVYSNTVAYPGSEGSISVETLLPGTYIIECKSSDKLRLRKRFIRLD